MAFGGHDIYVVRGMLKRLTKLLPDVDWIGAWESAGSDDVDRSDAWSCRAEAVESRSEEP